MSKRDEEARDLVQRLSAGKMSRRQFMTRASALGLTAGAIGSILAACGGKDDAAPATAPTEPAPTESAPGESTAPAGTVDIAGDLDHFTWEGYDLPGIIDPWLDANGVSQNVTLIGVQADVEAKLLSPAGKGVDLTSANQAFIQSYLDFGIVRPISVEEVPSLAKLFPRWQQFPYRNDDGTFNVVPWTWGSLGLTYSPERVGEVPESWEIVFDPAFKDRVVMLDDAQNNVSLAALILGFNPDELTQEQFAEVKDFLGRVMKQSKTLAPSFGDIVSLFAAGEVDLNFLGWIGTDVFIEGAETKTIVPAKNPDGSLGRSLAFCDCAMIPPDADNVPAALAFSEQLISGQIAADAAAYLAAGTTNPEVVALIDETTRALFPYDDLGAFFERVALPNGFPRESDEFVTFDETVKGWEDVKAAAL
ncbi:MAG: ABC transporter substrate-binding protein [Thermoleophilia bacterium]|nr:ABC transporter substrate-binding protein [Thermoleophilia bacterium]